MVAFSGQERGILKEANLERKINSHENSSTTSENSQVNFHSFYTISGLLTTENMG